MANHIMNDDEIKADEFHGDRRKQQDAQITERTEIDRAEGQIIFWRNKINDKGVWLFLSTIGCLGIPHFFLKAIAFFVILVIYASDSIYLIPEGIRLIRKIEQLRTSKHPQVAAKAFEVFDEYCEYSSIVSQCWLWGISLSFYILTIVIEYIWRPYMGT